MNNQAILIKAIEKAVANGLNVNAEYATQAALTSMGLLYGYEYPCGFLFSHNFAKALWGDRFINPELRDDTGSKVIAIKQTAWKHHLRQMVIADDPIKYLGENI